MLHPKFLSLDLLNQLPMDNDAIDLSKFIQLPGGGTHDIYQLRQNPGFLLKVVRNSVGNDTSILESKLAGLTEKYATLYETFGGQRCLPETRCIKKIKQSDSQDAKNAIISLVAFDNCFQSKDRFGFNTETVEVKEPKLKANMSRYHAMNSSLLGRQEDLATFKEDDFLFFHKSFRTIFEQLDTDPKLKEVMKEFLHKFKQYYGKTDQLLDFTGRDNVLFYKDEKGDWQYKVGSVIKTETGKKAKQLIREIESNPSIVKDSFENWTHIFFVPSWLRVVNATAAKLGMGKVIDDILVTPQDIANLSSMHEMLKLNERAVNCADEHDFEAAQHFFDQYQAQEKVHDTWTRHMLGTYYWRFVQNNEELRPKQEMNKFLNLLIDAKNEYPKAVWDELHKAIVGLVAQLEKHGPIEHDTAEKVDKTLKKTGFIAKHKQDDSLEALLSTTIKKLEPLKELDIALSDPLINKPITLLRDIRDLSSQATVSSETPASKLKDAGAAQFKY